MFHLMWLFLICVFHIFSRTCAETLADKIEGLKEGKNFSNKKWFSEPWIGLTDIFLEEFW